MHVGQITIHHSEHASLEIGDTLSITWIDGTGNIGRVVGIDKSEVDVRIVIAIPAMKSLATRYD